MIDDRVKAAYLLAKKKLEEELSEAMLESARLMLTDCSDGHNPDERIMAADKKIKDIIQKMKHLYRIFKELTKDKSEG